MFEQLLSRFRDPLEVAVGDADKIFLEQRKEEIEHAESEAAELAGELEEALQRLQGSLTELEGYEDPDGRSRVEDTVANIVEERQRRLQELDISKEPEQLFEDVSGFVDAFHDMTPKQKAVLKHVGEEKKPVFDDLQEVERVLQELNDVLENRYTVVERYDRIEENVEERQRLLDRLQTVETEIEELEESDLQQERENIAEELEELKQSTSWDAYQTLQEEREELQREGDARRETIKKAGRKMGRGLKKLLYDRNPSGIDVLRDIEQENWASLFDTDPGTVADAVADASDRMPQDLLDEAQMEKFRSGADTLAGFPEVMDEIQEIEEELRGIEIRLENHDAVERKERLEREKERIENELEEEQEQRAALIEEKQEIMEEIEAVEDQVISLMEEEFAREIHGSGRFSE